MSNRRNLPNPFHTPSQWRANRREVARTGKRCHEANRRARRIFGGAPTQSEPVVSAYPVR